MEGKYDIRCSFRSPNYDDFCFLKPWNKKRVNAVVQTSLEAQDSRYLTHLLWGAQWSSWQHPSRKLWKCSHISEKSKMCIIHARSSDSHTSPDLCRCLAFSQVIGLKTCLSSSDTVRWASVHSSRDWVDRLQHILATQALMIHNQSFIWTPATR